MVAGVIRVDGDTDARADPDGAVLDAQAEGRRQRRDDFPGDGFDVRPA